MNVNGCKMLPIAGMAVNKWKWLEMAGNGLQLDGPITVLFI